MYFVDREQIERSLQYFDRQLNLFSSVQSFRTSLEQAALERVTHMMIESMMDVGNAMIDGFIMRDPGSYEDVLAILYDEKVIDGACKEAASALLPFRKKLMQDYTNVPHEDIVNTLSTYKDQFAQFSLAVREYLATQLGPVSAFKPS
ncbi:DUF86 domain-containing protein [Bacillus fonticola]|uniref:DUF86 domain-containing protein n=1 Tax=Bacillus fonticola TaxID=2728853 RepID=UPI001473F40C|nr:DUF86 domain-containing protein [Bacillus fonticola]